MKRKQLMFGAAALLMAAGVMFAVSCNSDRTGTVSSPTTVNSSAQGGTNATFVATSTGVFTFHSPEAHDFLARAGSSDRYHTFLQRWEAMGYTYAPEYSYVMQGKGMPDNAEALGITDSVFVQITTLAMVYSPDPMKRACYFNYVHSRYGDFVQSYILAFGNQPPDNSFENVTQGVWAAYDDVVMLSADKSKHITDASAWSWREWGKCTLATTLYACGTAAGECEDTGPAYAGCVAIGCGTGAVGAAICCAIAELFLGD